MLYWRPLQVSHDSLQERDSVGNKPRLDLL